MTALPKDAGVVLTTLARRAITDRLRRATKTVRGPQPWLAASAASFVTLTKQDELRGCVGSLLAWRPLGDDVIGNARSAAFEDQRFPPVLSQEINDLRIEVSVLSPPRPLSFDSQAAAIEQIRPGVDGVILEVGGRRATFLPQVWQEIPDAVEFLGQLKRKAGLRADFWSDQVKLSLYTVAAFREMP